MIVWLRNFVVLLLLFIHKVKKLWGSNGNLPFLFSFFLQLLSSSFFFFLFFFFLGFPCFLLPVFCILFPVQTDHHLAFLSPSDRHHQTSSSSSPVDQQWGSSNHLQWLNGEESVIQTDLFFRRSLGGFRWHLVRLILGKHKPQGNSTCFL